MDFSFSGCGFLGIYHVGVASCLKQYAPHLLINNKLCGASAGGMIAACLMCGCDLGQITSYSLRIASKARSRSLGPLHPSFNIHKILRDGLEEILPNNAHEICSGNLFISLTRVHDRKNVQVSQFDTRDDLISALLCSSFIPFYSGMIPPAYKGVRYVDGGLSDNSPVIDENTVTVTPFAGESDICPMDKNNHIFQVYLANTSMQLTFHNLSRFSNIFFPPHPDILSNMCQQGFDDTLKFLQRNDLISCKRCFKIRTSIVPAPLAPTPPIGQDENSDDSDFHSESEDENCEECQKQKQQELIDSLPQQVLSAFEAIKSKGVLMKIADSRVYTVASLMVQPWVLPVEVVYLLGKRFLTWVPYLPMDTHWAVSEAFELLKMVVRYINRGRHRYSARFAYQLAVTDLTFNEEELLPSSHEEIYSARASTMRRIEMEMDLAKDAESRHDSAMRCLEEIRHQIIEAEDSEPQHVHHHHHHHHDDHHHHHKRPSKDFRMSLETTEGHEGDNYDTFDDCLRIADEMDAIWSYYYTDENNPNIVKVMEVYGVPDSEDGENVSASLDTASAENVPALELFQ